ncbi:MAG: hypothetical protein AB8W37_12630 [Arsenophonus endosymbiont of Dermacentor nuttalli]
MVEQTFSQSKSIVSRIFTAISDILFGSKIKSEIEIMKSADLVAYVMRVNIERICHTLNQHIANGKVDGIYRKST